MIGAASSVTPTAFASRVGPSFAALGGSLYILTRSPYAVLRPHIPSIRRRASLLRHAEVTGIHTPTWPSFHPSPHCHQPSACRICSRHCTRPACYQRCGCSNPSSRAGCNCQYPSGIRGPHRVHELDHPQTRCPYGRRIAAALEWEVFR